MVQSQNNLTALKLRQAFFIFRPAFESKLSRWIIRSLRELMIHHWGGTNSKKPFIRFAHDSLFCLDRTSSKLEFSPNKKSCR